MGGWLDGRSTVVECKWTASAGNGLLVGIAFMTYFKFLIVALLGFMMIGSLEFTAPVWAESSMEKLQLVLHQGRPHGGRHERHQMHHGMGRGGGGICPQTRTTPQAPDEFVKMKNPLELTVENLTRGEDLYQWSAEPSACKVCHGATGNGLRFCLTSPPRL